MRLASGDTSSAFVAGQQYADDLVDEGIKRSKGKVGLQEVLAIVANSGSYEQLRENLRTEYADMSASSFVELFERALILSELAGRFALLDEL